jgi:thioredoxin-like negative regulator of GroEL
MKALCTIFLLLAVISKVTKASSILSTKNTHIVELNDENFEHLTQASKGQTTGKWFVNFSTPTCPHCVSLYPKWQTLAEEITNEHQESSVIIGIVDITKNPKLVGRFHIKSMPVLYYFADGGMYEYAPQKPREVGPFLDYVLGGYKLLEGKEKMEVPTVNGLLQLIENLRRNLHSVEFVSVILKDFEDIVLKRKNAAALLFGAGVVMGVLLCMLKNAVMALGGGSKVKKD